MTSLQFDGHELLRTDDPREDVWFGAFILAPWAGLLREGRLHHDDVNYEMPLNWDGHSLHGVARFAVFEETDGPLIATLPPQWPFGGKITVTPRLSGELLEVRLTVTAGGSSMPVAVGWHPWFRRALDGIDASVSLPDDAARLERDDDGLATGRWTAPGNGPWDDCFRTAKPVDVRWPGIGALSVGSAGGYIGIFDGEASGIAVEPMTAPVGTLPKILNPGESLSLDVVLRWTRS